MTGTAEETTMSVSDEGTGQSQPTEQDTAGGGDDTNKVDAEANDAAAHGDAAKDDNASPDKKRPLEDKAAVDDGPMPTLPLKKARTAYFIFADEKREGLKELVRKWCAIVHDQSGNLE